MDLTQNCCPFPECYGKKPFKKRTFLEAHIRKKHTGEPVPYSGSPSHLTRRDQNEQINDMFYDDFDYDFGCEFDNTAVEPEIQEESQVQNSRECDIANVVPELLTYNQRKSTTILINTTLLLIFRRNNTDPIGRPVITHKGKRQSIPNTLSKSELEAAKLAIDINISKSNYKR